MKIYVAGIILSWFLVAGLLNAHIKAELPWQDLRGRRQSLGVSFVASGGLSVFWPVGIPAAFCYTGFAQDGWNLTWAAAGEG